MNSNTKSITIKVSTTFHKELKQEMLNRDTTIQDFVYPLIEQALKDLKNNR